MFPRSNRNLELLVRVAIYAGFCLPIDAESLETRPLGGTETGIIRPAQILSRRGHDVVVFSSKPDPSFSVPPYISHTKLLECGPFDVFVAVQDWRSIFFGARRTRAFLWTGDGWDQYANFGMGDRRVAARIERLLCVSSWQAQTLAEKSGFPPEKAVVVGNGVHLPYFEGSERRLRKRLIYTAAPYRGLELLPPIYQEIKRRHPEAELHILSGMSIYDRDKPYNGPEVAKWRRLEILLQSLPDCHVHGNVLQHLLAREYMKSALLVYPNVSYETCCITAMEAQAAGCPVVASRNSALPETVADAGVLVEGAPGSEKYMRGFVEAVDRLLSDDALWTHLSETGRRRAEAEFSWEHVADRFEQALCRGLEYAA